MSRQQRLYGSMISSRYHHQIGLFDTICNLLSIIGKRFQDAGLRDLCVESGVIAEGSVTGVMDGRKYNHAIRLHKLVYEALMRLAWKGFLPWLELKHAGEFHHFNKAMKSIANLQDGVSQAVFLELLECESCIHILQLYQTYLHSIRISMTFQHSGCHILTWKRLCWSCFEPPERLIGCCILHPSGRLIPWCFSYDRLNYARFMPYYYATMSQLPY